VFVADPPCFSKIAVLFSGAKYMLKLINVYYVVIIDGAKIGIYFEFG
jgi:hypothetical protein